MKTIFAVLLMVATNACAQTINTIAGNGTTLFSGDGGPATDAGIVTPKNVIYDKEGAMYICDAVNARVRKVSTSGIITTVAGNGGTGSGGDGGLATAAELSQPVRIAFDTAGNMYVVQYAAARIRKIDATTGIITLFAGNMTSGPVGDGGPATAATLIGPTDVITDKHGNVYIAENAGHRVRKIDTHGTITTIAGTGVFGYSGDGGPATDATLHASYSLAIDEAGNIFVADSYNSRIRKIAPDGTITTVCGGGTTPIGEGVAATAANIGQTCSVAVDKEGNIYFSIRHKYQVYRSDPAGLLHLVAGTGTSGFSGDGGPATAAQLSIGEPHVDIDPYGNIVICDERNNRVRRIGDANSLADIPPSRVIMFPNPVAKEMTVAFMGKVDYLEIYDLHGRRHLSKKVSSDKVTIDVHLLGMGLYLLKASNGQSVVFQKE